MDIFPLARVSCDPKHPRTAHSASAPRLTDLCLLPLCMLQVVPLPEKLFTLFSIRHIHCPSEPPVPWPLPQGALALQAEQTVASWDPHSCDLVF